MELASNQSKKRDYAQFLENHPSDFDDNGTARRSLCHLRAFSANRVVSNISPSKLGDLQDTTLLAVARGNVGDESWQREESSHRLRDSLDETGALFSIQDNQRQIVLGVRLLSQTSFNLQFAINSLTYCLANHLQTCSTIESSPVESLRVIDCRAHTIIRAPSGCQYVALSYVWGCPTSSKTSAVDQSFHSTLQNAPKVVNDAIEVTLKLGLQYLWIDRYCIDQSNKEDKHNTIQVMDLIYANARLTIIAAAGETPDYGLPGVRGTIRKFQPYLKVGKHFMVSTLPHPSFVIKNSKWSSRGWTYQEGLWSKRRLIFTDHQVFYECNGMHCAESLILPMDKLHIESKKKYKACVPHGAFIHKDPGKKPLEIMSYIAEFSKRDLTFPSEALNALQGIFNLFRNGKRPVYHLAGVPILPTWTAFNDNTLHKPVNRNPEENFLIGLSWRHTKSGNRRQYSPSWSWAGWEGELSPFILVGSKSATGFNDVKVWIEDEDGKLRRFPASETLDLFPTWDQCNNKYIHIEALTIQVSWVYLRRDLVLSTASEDSRNGLASTIKEDGYYIKLQKDDETALFLKLHLDLSQQLFQDACREPTERALTGLLLGKQSLREFGGFVLVIQDMGEYAERIGAFGFYWYSCLVDNNKNGWASLGFANYPMSTILGYEKLLEELPTAKKTIRLA